MLDVYDLFLKLYVVFLVSQELQVLNWFGMQQSISAWRECAQKSPFLVGVSAVFIGVIFWAEFISKF